MSYPAPSLAFRLRCLAATALVFCGSALVLRLVLPLAFPADLPVSPGIVVGIGLGFINDLAPLSFGLLAPAAILLLPTDRFIRRGAGRFVCLAVLFLFSAVVIFSTCAEYFFWEEFHARFNFIAVDYLIYTTELIRNAIESYPLGFILPAIGIAAALVSLAVWRRLLRRAWSALRPEDEPSGLLRRLGLLLCLHGLAGLVFVLFTPLHFAQDRFWREYVKDGVYEIFSAFRHNQLDYRAFYRTMDAGEAFALMREERKAQGVFRPDSADLVRDIVAPGTEARPHVILVIMESMGSKWLDHSPNLRNLAENGLSFTNMLSTGTRTVRGIEAIMLGVPPTPGNSIVRRPNNAGLFSLGTLFREKDYDLSFIYGGYGYFDNMNAFFSANGYRIVDKTVFAAHNKTFSTAWGQCDEDLLNQSLLEADAVHARGKLFQQVLLTTSNHRPFTYPEGKVDIAPGSSRTGAVVYSDYAIGRFMEAARTRPWFDNTIFIFVGDHPSAVAGRTEVPADAYGIVCIMYGPKFFQPHTVDTLCSQIDVAPTLFSRLNWSYRSQFFGENAVTIPPERGRAWIATYLLLGFRTLDGLAVLDPRGKADVAAITPAGERAVRESAQDAAWRRRLVDLTVGSYQCAYDLFTSGKLAESYVRQR